MARTRIFVTTSHISCVYMTLHAQRTHQPGDLDILLVDIGTRRREVVAAIHVAARSHSWHTVHSFSVIVNDEHPFEPSLRKKLTRKWKELPVVRALYAWLLARHVNKRDAWLITELERLVPSFDKAVDLQVFGHTQTLLNKLIARARPDAQQSFFEHGLGDYHYIQERGRLQGSLFAVFAEPFRTFLTRRGIPPQGIEDLQLPADMAGIALEQIKALGHADKVMPPHPVDKPVVLILLEAVDMYEVHSTFWGAYIDQVLTALDGPENYHFVLKPHPIASRPSLQATITHCRSLGLSYTLLDEGWQKGIAAEVLFAPLVARTQHVFCLFSSACFYLSQLYRDPHITYHYSTSFMAKWIDNAPPMYKRHFNALVPLIEEVFSERCQPY